MEDHWIQHSVTVVIFGISVNYKTKNNEAIFSLSNPSIKNLINQFTIELLANLTWKGHIYCITHSCTISFPVHRLSSVYLEGK